MIQREYTLDAVADVSRETLAYERMMQVQLEKAQARVEAIKAILQRAKEQRLDLEMQSIN